MEKGLHQMRYSCAMRFQMMMMVMTLIRTEGIWIW
jgi:hypothetical protein